MNLAKNCIDIGLQTNNLDDMLNFWQTRAGLTYEELLKVGGGIHQHRHSLNGSVFKMNHLRDPLPHDDPAGYRELLIARDTISEPLFLTDPDGNNLGLVPRGYLGITGIGLKLCVRSLSQFADFYSQVLQLDSVSNQCFRWGTSLLFLEEDKGKKVTLDMKGKGYRYITVQVYDVDQEHAALLARGGTEARAPVTLGSTARISFIKDPDGNWIEISQRASLTGDIPTH